MGDHDNTVAADWQSVLAEGESIYRSNPTPLL